MLETRSILDLMNVKARNNVDGKTPSATWIMIKNREPAMGAFDTRNERCPELRKD